MSIIIIFRPGHPSSFMTVTVFFIPATYQEHRSSHKANALLLRTMQSWIFHFAGFTLLGIADTSQAVQGEALIWTVAGLVLFGSRIGCMG
ncbi:hypothetical protein C8Q75DRAFT_314544 [Abortiporus biennis]|nr:hypothetical protein C8Q75DRAFT_314544 [Abortiporus biennis]